MADPVYDDSLFPWWMKSLIESGKSGLEILDERASDALEWTGDVWGAATDSEAERAARKQQNVVLPTSGLANSIPKLPLSRPDTFSEIRS